MGWGSFARLHDGVICLLVIYGVLHHFLTFGHVHVHAHAYTIGLDSLIYVSWGKLRPIQPTDM